MTAKRLFDVAIAALALLVASPVVLIAAIGIRLTSPGPILYRAQRAGLHGASFEMLKLRTMHASDCAGAQITAPNDVRVFAFGELLRKLKVDELPQFLNVLKGDMAIIGPRPESKTIVDKYYTGWMRETLLVKPGITSSGALFNYEHGEAYLDPEDLERSYVERLLPVKLAIERAYLERQTFFHDICLLLRTAASIPRRVVRMRSRLSPKERASAARWCGEDAFERKAARLSS